jgi:tRNA(fMet)-specific endonuclease VapC
VLVLDTDQVSELGYGTEAGLRLRDRLLGSGQEVATTIVTGEEQLRGWLAEIHRLDDPHKQISAYDRLRERIEFFERWTVLRWDAAAADLFPDWRRQGMRIGSKDLKIACIALLQRGTLLTRNTRDFTRVPGLNIEDWTRA